MSAPTHRHKDSLVGDLLMQAELQRIQQENDIRDMLIAAEQARFAKKNFDLEATLAFAAHQIPEALREELIEDLRFEWIRVDVENEGVLTRKKLKRAVWLAADKRTNTEFNEPPELPPELQVELDKILSGTGCVGPLDTISFWQFANFFLTEEDILLEPPDESASDSESDDEDDFQAAAAAAAAAKQRREQRTNQPLEQLSEAEAEGAARAAEAPEHTQSTDDPDQAQDQGSLEAGSELTAEDPEDQEADTVPQEPLQLEATAQTEQEQEQEHEPEEEVTEVQRDSTPDTTLQQKLIEQDARLDEDVRTAQEEGRKDLERRREAKRMAREATREREEAEREGRKVEAREANERRAREASEAREAREERRRLQLESANKRDKERVMRLQQWRDEAARIGERLASLAQERVKRRRAEAEDVGKLGHLPETERITQAGGRENLFHPGCFADLVVSSALFDFAIEGWSCCAQSHDNSVGCHTTRQEAH